MTDSACLVCDANTFEPHLEILRKCGNCGFVTARTDGAVDYRSLYDGDYFKGEEYLNYAADEAFFKRNFRRRLDDVRRFTSAGRLLEIGSAYGFFLDLARRHFDVLGFEVNAEAVRHAREKLQLDVRTSDFLGVSTEQTGGRFDVAVMWDVIEHLERPELFIERLAEHVRPGGSLHITTGDIGSLLARLRGRKWRMIHPPTHLHYFDRRTLPRLLAKHGFNTVEIASVGVARSLQQVLYSILVLHLRAESLFTVSKKYLRPDWGFTLNTFDIMRVTATRS